MAKFTERMRVSTEWDESGGLCIPHRVLRPLTGYMGATCPDPTRRIRESGKAALEIVMDARAHPENYEWIAIQSKCGNDLVVDFILNDRDPTNMPEAILEPEEPIEVRRRKKKVIAEVEGT